MEQGEAILSFRHVTGKAKKFYLKDINLDLQPGYIYGLIGENGAGKTTLMKYIINENAEYDGQICMEGEDIKTRHAEIMNKIGYVSEDNCFFGDRTGLQNVELLGRFYKNFDMEKFMDTMEQMELSAKKTYRLMSRGEQLKFQLAFAAGHNPCLYLLDEVTVGMDPVFRLEFFAALRNLTSDEKCCVLMTNHVMSEVEMKTDYVGVMRDGRLAEFTESLDIALKQKEERQVGKR
ncbi:MAG: ABC transporter ATP-binding protein [Clostridium sp.]|nr:ABC transporter ATP-binding protein [Clostridium sp.]